MSSVRIGVVGLGIMGSVHAAYLHNGLIDGAILGAICHHNPAKLAQAAATFPQVPTFSRFEDLLNSSTCDAILIATPHYDHPPKVLAAFAKNLHVLVEKPLAVTLKSADEILHDYARYPHLKFGMMYNQRTNPMYQTLRQIITTGELGHISRITWLITNWFRTHAYYNSSPWRTTWKGEGGGVLINQCLHNLDLLYWTLGNIMPRRITAIAHTGKTHPIEVEDEVSAILEYQNGERGAIAHFITTTGEYPGTNRLEIAGTRGKIIAENNTLTLTKTLVDTQEFNRTSPQPFGTPETTTTTLPFPPPANEHQKITQDFTNAIRHNTPNENLLAPGTDGPHALELANAILMAGLTRSPVQLPLNPNAYETFLDNLIQD